MPRCTVKYEVRLVPKLRDALPVHAIGVFAEERAPDERGEPGPLVSRRLDAFTGPAGPSIKAMVTQGDSWEIDVQDRIGPLEWDN
jgi:hypothetical protein